jgi:hypothetical protein
VSTAAELLADGGEAAASPEFFRSAPFMEAEGVTHTLRVEADGDELRGPLVVREIADAERGATEERGTRNEERAADATSPYGYPGFSGPASAPLDPGEVDWAGTGLVSIFIRHRLGAPPPMAGATERGRVQIADPSLPRKSRMSDRQQIRRNLKRGYQIRRIEGPEAGEEDRAGFLRAYAETMRRAGASERYFFGKEYFDRILRFQRSWLFVAVAPGGELAAGSIGTQSDGMLHYYLSGTADAFLRDSSMKNIVSAMSDFAEELELPLNLGGGVEPGDALEGFKRGFANRTEPFYTSEVVCDAARYERLSTGRQRAGFFPAYRAP